MQTFLPDTNYRQCAKILDNDRLGKQMLEAAQVLSVLLGKRWIHKEGKYVDVPMELLPHSHPVVKMWSGHEGSLLNYFKEMVFEWMDRNRVMHTTNLLRNVWVQLRPLIHEDAYEKPSWLTEEFASAYRSILLGKDFHSYDYFGWSETPAVPDPITKRWPYPWPVSTSPKQG